MDGSLREDDAGPRTFAVELDVFSGPFSVLLSLIAKKRLDVTEVALAEVTDEFVAFTRSQSEFDLSQTSEFLVVAATLLDLKASRLLPHEDPDEEDFELLEQRDMLFAKLLQYRAFKEVAQDIGRRLSTQSLSAPRDVPMEEQFANALPKIRLTIGPTDLAVLAVAALTREREKPEVTTEHLHDPLVPVDGQMAVIRERLAAGDRPTFADLCGDAPDIATVVARFLALLQMLRAGQIAVEQERSLGSILVRARREPAPDGSEE